MASKKKVFVGYMCEDASFDRLLTWCDAYRGGMLLFTSDNVKQIKTDNYTKKIRITIEEIK